MFYFLCIILKQQPVKYTPNTCQGYAFSDDLYILKHSHTLRVYTRALMVDFHSES